MPIKPVRILTALVMVAGLFGCQTKKHMTVPEELVGVWKTSAPQYADRFFELREVVIVIDTGQGTISVNFVQEVAEVRAGDQILYTIYYAGQEGTKSEWSFYYDPSHGRAIRFKNQMQIAWTKVNAS